jgi:hypothetical protein
VFAQLSKELEAHPLQRGAMLGSSRLAYRVLKSVIREHILSCSALHALLLEYPH